MADDHSSSALESTLSIVLFLVPVLVGIAIVVYLAVKHQCCVKSREYIPLE
jgi:Ca2+/H+ antiporter